jgi:hypothetical protein
MYTEDGVEIGVDSRVFALFGMMNALGYDDDTVRGPAPLHRPQYASARSKLRANLGRPGAALKAFDDVLSKNPGDPAQFTAAVLELGPAPNFEDKAAKSALAKAIAGPMRDWYNEEGGAGVLRLVMDDAKPTQKRLRPLLDKAVKATTQLIRLGNKEDQLLDDAGAVGRVALVINDLDRHSSIARIDGAGVTYVVVGPGADAADDDAAINAVVDAYARTLVARDAAKSAKPGTLADASKLTKAKLDDKQYTAELLACAFAQKVRPKSGCVGSPIAGDPAAVDALAVLAPRVDAFAGDTTPLSAGVDALLAPAPAAAPPPDATPPPKEAPKKEAPKKEAPKKKGTK